jgi:hypothetical protein
MHVAQDSHQQQALVKVVQVTSRWGIPWQKGNCQFLRKVIQSPQLHKIQLLREKPTTMTCQICPDCNVRSQKVQQDATVYQIFISPYLCEAQHASGDTTPIIRSLKLHWQPLVLHTWKVVGRVVAGRCCWRRPPTTHPTTFHICKSRGCQCSFRLLMMGVVSPETCWASHKYKLTEIWYTFASCWTFCELYYDTRIHEHQV